LSKRWYFALIAAGFAALAVFVLRPAGVEEPDSAHARTLAPVDDEIKRQMASEPRLGRAWPRTGMLDTRTAAQPESDEDGDTAGSLFFLPEEGWGTPTLSVSTSDTECQRLYGDVCGDPRPGDMDADGYQNDVDCDDHDHNAHPGGHEIRCNNLDEDCSGADLCPPDRDGDGAGTDIDCNDNDPRQSPTRQEIPCNAIDDDCDGTDICDRDGDGDYAPYDCNDNDLNRFRGAKDVACDRVDQDCDGVDCCDNDADGDGIACKNDCDDADSSVYPGAPIPPGCHRRDLDCDGSFDGTCN
jgi:hypothetical protein